MPDLPARADCIYQYLRRYIAEHRHAPTQREIGNACGIASIGSVNYWLHRLVGEYGLITIEPGAARTIVLVEQRAPEMEGC